ncbi:unnamed protein product (macronuclear) [Paramecium tetraurelia]|uniref:Major facilitator superfamily (MFS) profile domain-containing protein n=1 Tax=Paramecium tetraurelia TaxID=5888 RepID=A0C8F5_PARTE|nr:uncharacterized protein GSPATT00036205001 [Paramecium tetraurelia]CAK67072.1 unnamed protein product [Paramecium tetraurelia]|eukprot:XP_001434469.1 hypothetical protein (macronuclear) [Paramecium tetraurelia strain d4-2]
MSGRENKNKMNYLLILLYIYQSTILSLFTIIIPILLAEKGYTFEQQGMYSLISYPFYFKFLFAPIIDLYQFQFLGKRKSYILPINLILSVILLYLSRMDILTNYHILWIFGFILCLFLGIQDIAIDGLATDLCKQEGESAALLQNIGFTIGNSFLGNFLFIALYSNQICSLETFFMLLSIVGLILTIFLYVKLLEKEEQEKRATTFQDLLSVFKSFFKNENMITYSLLIFFERTALSSLDATFRLKLVQFNINKTYISFIDTIILPLKIATGLIYHQYFYKFDFKYYGNIQYLRLISTFFAILTLLLIDKFELEGPFSYIAIFFSNMCWWVLFNITYIVRGNFQMKITTPGVEATTLTILNSISQLGVKLAFSVNLIMANYVNYYWLLCAGWIIHLLYCFRYSETYRNLYMQPIQKWYLNKQIKQI